MFLELLRLALVLGGPVALVAWFVFARLFDAGVVARDATRKEVESREGIRAGAARDPFVHRLTRFGGGFYGVAAVWTLLAAEARDVVGLLADPAGTFALLGSGFGGLLGAFIENQVQNLVASVLWWHYWSDAQPLAALAVGFAGFRVGLSLARRTPEGWIDARLDELRARWRRALGSARGDR